MKWMLMPLRRYADFKGRSRRKEFWLWTLFNIIVIGILYAIFSLFAVAAAERVADRGGVGRLDGNAGTADFEDGYGYGYTIDPYMMSEELGAAGWILFSLMILWGLFTLIPNLAVQIRRLHDSDKTGWLILLALVPFIGGLILIVLFLLPGTRGPNRFGPDPKGQEPEPGPAYS